jgi:hypothetical protein
MSITQMSHDFNHMEQKFYLQMNIINSAKQECDYLTGLLRFQEEETFKNEVADRVVTLELASRFQEAHTAAIGAD